MKHSTMVLAFQAAFLLLASSINAGVADSSEKSRSLNKHHSKSSVEGIRLFPSLFGRTLTHYYDDDDGYRRRRGSYKRPKGKSKKSSKKKSAAPRTHSSPSGSSSSLTRLKGVLRIVVIGKENMCFIKVFQSRYRYREQFGDTTSTSAFIDLYGHGECEPGAVGIAHGVVKAGVIAMAHRRGPKCEANVMSYVIAKTRDLDPNDGVSVMVRGAAGGEALAECS